VTRAFRRVDERVVHDGHLQLAVAAIEGPDGTTFEREVLRQRGAVAVVAVDDARQVTLVRQYRAALDDDLLEIPAGLLDVEGEERLACAQRELAEEVGLAADSWELLTTFVNSAGSSDQRTTIYLATGLSDVPDDRQGAEEAEMTVERVRFDDAVAMVERGEITDAKTVIGLLLAARRRGTGS
jgi:ADP-ribose pyrophosphatase